MKILGQSSVYSEKVKSKGDRWKELNDLYGDDNFRMIAAFATADIWRARRVFAVQPVFFDPGDPRCV